MAAPWDSSSSSWAGLTFSGSSANSTIDGDVLAVSSAAVGEEDAFWQFTLVTDTVDDERTAFGVVTKPVTAQHYDAECCRMLRSSDGEVHGDGKQFNNRERVAPGSVVSFFFSSTSRTLRAAVDDRDQGVLWTDISGPIFPAVGMWGFGRAVSISEVQTGAAAIAAYARAAGTDVSAVAGPGAKAPAPSAPPMYPSVTGALGTVAASAPPLPAASALVAPAESGSSFRRDLSSSSGLEFEGNVVRSLTSSNTLAVTDLATDGGPAFWEWEITTDDRGGECSCFGVTTLPVISDSYDGPSCYTLRAFNGALYSEGSVGASKATAHPGDRVGVLADSGAISFSINGIDQGVCFSDVEGTVHGVCGFYATGREAKLLRSVSGSAARAAFRGSFGLLPVPGAGFDAKASRGSIKVTGGGLTPSTDAKKLAVGSRVRVKPAVSSPQYGWGSVQRDSVGTIASLDSSGDCIVNFPRHMGWRGRQDEVEVFDTPAGSAGSAPRAIGVGDSVRVRPSITSPQYGLGSSVSHSSVGTIITIDDDGDCIVNFPGHEGWRGKVCEVELSDPSAPRPPRLFDTVRVKRSVTPAYGFGSASHESMGTITSIDASGDCKVAFPEHMGWTGKLTEMELADRSSRRPLCIGDVVRVKPSVSSPSYGFGSVSHSSVGTLQSISDDGNCKIDFPEQSDWTGRLLELETVDPFTPGVGDTVSLKKSVSSPTYGLGSITHDSIGVILQSSADGDCVVDFPGSPMWRGKIPEMELAATSVAGHQEGISVGDRVRVKRSVSSPAFGFGSVTHNSVGTVRELTESGTKCKVDFPEQSSWAGLSAEMEVIRGARSSRAASSLPDERKSGSVGPVVESREDKDALAVLNCEFSTGRAVWEFRLDKDSANDEATAFGITTVPVMGARYNSSSVRMLRAWNGKLYGQGSTGATLPKVHPTDLVRAELDMDAGTLSFSVNGTVPVVAFTGVTDAVRPAVSFYAKGKQVSLVRVLHDGPREREQTDVALDQTASSGGLMFSNGARTVASTASGDTLAVSTHGFSTGMWTWDVRIDQDARDDECTAIGAVTKPIAAHKYQAASSFMYRAYNGVLYGAGSVSGSKEKAHEGDVVSVTLDADAGTLSFAINGTSQGVCFTGLRGPVFPAVAFYSSGRRATLVSCKQLLPSCSSPDVAPATDSVVTSWDQAKSAGPSILLSNGGRTMASTASDHTIAVVDTTILAGTAVWEITVDKDDAGDEALCYGISRIPVSASSYKTKGVWAYRGYNGKAYSDGTELPGKRRKIHQGDVVRHILDMEAGTLSYIVNGDNQGVVFTGISGPVAPCVMAYSAGKQATIGGITATRASLAAEGLASRVSGGAGGATGSFDTTMGSATGLVYSNGNMTVTSNAGGNTLAVVGGTVHSGKKLWVYKLDRDSKGDECSCFGVTRLPVASHSYDAANCRMLRAYNGQLYGVGSVGGQRRRIHPGDRVAVLADLDRHTLSFAVNGKSLGVCFTGLEGPVCGAIGFYASNKAVTLVAIADGESAEAEFAVTSADTVTGEPVVGALWDTDASSAGNLTFSNGGLTTRSTSSSQSMAVMEAGLSSGVHLIEFSLDEDKSGDECSCFGLVVKPIASFGYDAPSSRMVRAYNGQLYGSRARGASRTNIHSGDVVGLEIDMLEGTMKLFINGIDEGVVFDGLRELGTVYPAVAFYGSDRTVSIKRAIKLPSGFDPTLSSPSGLEFTNNNMAVASTTGSKTLAIVGRGAASGKTYWEFQIDEDKAGDECSCFGLTTLPITSHAYDAPHCLAYRAYNGQLYGTGVVGSNRDKAHQGGKVGLLYDADAHTVSLSVNGKSQGVCWNGVAATVHAFAGFYSSGRRVSLLRVLSGDAAADVFGSGFSSGGIAVEDATFDRPSSSSTGLSFPSPTTVRSESGGSTLALMSCGFSSGLYEVIFHLDDEKSGDEASALGVAAKPVTSHSYQAECCRMIRAYNGQLYGSGARTDSVAKIHPGASCTLQIDMDAGTMKAIIDGVDQGIVFSRLKELGTVYPAVGFYSSGRAVSVKRVARLSSGFSSVMGSSSGLAYSNAEMTVSSTTTSNTLAVVGRGFSSGKVLWTYSLDNDSNGGECTCFGVTSTPITKHSYDADHCRMLRAYNGQLYGTGRRGDNRTKIHPDDTVGVFYDADAGTISFAVNAVSQGVCFEGVTGEQFGAIGFYSSGRQVSLVSIQTGDEAVEAFGISGAAGTVAGADVADGVFDISASSSSGLSISNGGKTVMSSVSGNTLAVMRCGFSTGVHSFEFHLDEDSRNDECSCFGVTTKPISKHSYDADTCRMIRGYNGQLYGAGSVGGNRSKIHPGDSVVFELDMTGSGNLSLTINGDSQGVIFDGLKALATPIYPAVGFYSSGRSVTISRVVSVEQGFVTALGSTSGLEYSNENMTVSSVASGNTLAVLGRPITSGKAFWEFRLDEDSNTNECTCFGVTQLPVTTHSYDAPNARMLRGFNGQLYGSGAAASSKSKFHPGDKVGVFYDGDEKTLAFSVNGMSQGICFTGVSGPVAGAVGFYSSGRKATLLRSCTGEAAEDAFGISAITSAVGELVQDAIWDPAGSSGTGLTYLEGGKVIRSDSGSNTLALLQAGFNSGVHVFELILEEDTLDSECSAMGIACKPVSEFAYSSSSCRTIRCFSGALYGDNSKGGDRVKIHSGMTAVFTLDMDVGTLALSVNGADQGIIFDELAGQTWFPCVGFYGSGRQVRVGNVVKVTDGFVYELGSPEGVEYLNDNMTVRSEVSTHVLGVLGRGVATGVRYWEWTLDEDVKGNECVCFGLTQLPVTRYSYEAPHVHMLRCYNGSLNGKGAAGGSRHVVNPGDVVGMLFDADEKTLSFSVNGTSQGVCFKDVKTPAYGAVAMYGSGRQASLVRTLSGSEASAAFGTSTELTGMPIDGCAFDMSCSSPTGLNFSEAGRAVTSSIATNTLAVLQVGFAPGVGIGIVEFKLETDITGDEATCFGITKKPVRTHAYDAPHCYMVRAYNGALYGGGSIGVSRMKVHQGDLVRLEVNPTSGTVRLSIAGADQGIIFSGLSGTLFPAVGFYNKDRKVSITRCELAPEPEPAVPAVAVAAAGGAGGDTAVVASPALVGTVVGPGEFSGGADTPVASVTATATVTATESGAADAASAAAVPTSDSVVSSETSELRIKAPRETAAAEAPSRSAGPLGKSVAPSPSPTGRLEADDMLVKLFEKSRISGAKAKAAVSALEEEGLSVVADILDIDDEDIGDVVDLLDGALSKFERKRVHKMIVEVRKSHSGSAGGESGGTLGMSASSTATAPGALGGAGGGGSTPLPGRNAQETVRELSPQEIEIGPKIGKGSFGVVHRATWHGTAVAVKVPIQGVGGEGQAMEEFMKDLKAASSVGNHPNVVSLLGWTKVAGSPCVVTQFMEKGALLDVLRSASNRPPFIDLLKCVADCAAGLTHMHALGIVHRDIAARNVLIDAHNRGYIADFGFARTLASEEGVGQTVSNMGPVKWMAPESLTGAKEYSVKSDVYAFGVLLYELLANGVEPWPGCNFPEAIMAVHAGRTVVECLAALEKEGKPVTRDRSILALMNRCLKKEPLDRPTMGEVHRLLRLRIDEIAAGEDEAAEEEAASYYTMLG